MSDKNIKVVDENKKEEAPVETVSKEQYDHLLAQAIELQARYEKVVALYNVILEKYLSGK